MKKIIFIINVLLLVSLGLFAEEEPQVAYRLLDSYIQKKNIEAQDKTGWWITTGIGASLAVGGLTTYLVKDQFTQDIQYLETANIVAYSLMGSGVTLSTIGIIGLFSQPKDFHSEFYEVYAETSPKVREALAAAALEDLAISGKNKRIYGAIGNILVPIISSAIVMSFNLSEGREWYRDLSSTILSSTPNIIFSIMDFFTPSEEERLYEKYKAARTALYGS